MVEENRENIKTNFEDGNKKTVTSEDSEREEDLMRKLSGETKEPSVYPSILKIIKKRIRIKRIFYSVLFILGILAINLLVISPLFKGGYNSSLALTEGSLLSQAKFISENFSNPSWNPLWYLGFSFQTAFLPLVPYGVAILQAILGFLSISTIYRMISGIFYLMIPVSVYLLVRYLTRKEFTAVLAALLYSAPPLISFLAPAFKEGLAVYGRTPWQLIELVKLGKDSHLIALAFIPLAALFFLHSLKFPTFKRYLITAILIMLVGLSHWAGFISLIIILVIILFSEIILGRVGPKFKSAFWIFLISAGFLAFWYNISFLRISFSYGISDTLTNTFGSIIPLAFAIFPILGTALFLIFDRKPKLQPLFISLIWFGIFLFVVLIWDYGQKIFLPEPRLYLLELHLGASILIALALTAFIDFIRKIVRIRFPRHYADFIVTALIVIFIGISISLILTTFSASQKLAQPHQNIKETPEYKLGSWLEQNGQNTRVYATGSTSNWLNVFYSIPQFKGGSGLGALFPKYQEVSSQIESEEKEDISVLWLRALNLSYLVVNNPESEVFSSSYKDPDKFKYSTDLKPVYIQKGDIIYEVALAQPQLTQVVSFRDFENLESFSKATDEVALKAYVDYIDNPHSPSRASLAWENSQKAVISADLAENKGVAVQIPYDGGWKARVDGEDLKIEKDVLGFMFIQPSQEGEGLKIELEYEGTWDVLLGYGLTILTIIILFLSRTEPVKLYIKSFEERYQPRGALIKPTKGETFIDMMIEEPGSPGFDEVNKQYYKEVEDYDWVEATDNFIGLETFFHRNRERITKKLIDRFGVGKKYLDAGCGTGLLLRYLPPGSIGLDINPRAIIKAKRNAPKAALVVGDIEQIPFPDNMFSTVICTEVLDRLPNPKKAIREIWRVLKPGGILIGTAPRQNPMWRMRFLSSDYTREPYRVEYNRKQVEDWLKPFEKVLLSPALSYMTWVFVVRKPT